MAFVLPNSVMLHCPKTAGRWASSAMSHSGVPVIPLPLHTSSDNIPAEHSGKFRFAFVRHPLTWYQSFYAFKSVQGWCHDDVDRHCRASDFRQFVANALDRFPSGYCSTVLSNRYFKGVDFVGLFERLRPDLIKALTLAGEGFDGRVMENVPPKNVSNYELIDVHYSTELRGRVLESEKGIIERYYS